MNNEIGIGVGDVVKLKSHPTKLMTVNSIDGKFAECVWPGDRGESVFRNFELSALTLVTKKVAATGK
ncbi:MAG TPA: hypothetical protein VG737_05280 [Cyclobacteriaceae bacterium]|nr:hypothetical protein [Cyclobacteriaceae bacterium]